MLLFQETPPPAAHQRFTRKHQVRWLTWSPYFLQFLPAIKKQSRKYQEVDFVFEDQYQDYNYTYTVRLEALDPGFLEAMRHFVYDLHHFDPGEHIVFFHGLINRKVDGKTFHFLFALLRALLVQMTRDEMGALYSPLTSGKRLDDFPLHCDLYIPGILWNVMEAVARDGSGHSTFLPLRTLFEEVLPQVSRMEQATRTHLEKLVYSTVRQDHYDQFYQLLYREAWCREVIRMQRNYRWRILLDKGEGYLLHDRTWMHGRDRTHGGVSGKRLHRLIFNNYQCLH